MVDPRFYQKNGPFSLKELCELTGAELTQVNQGAHIIKGVAPLLRAHPHHVAVFHNRKYLEDFQKSQAGACFVDQASVGKAPAHMVCLVTSKPYRAYAKALAAFYAEDPPTSGISAHAFIDSSARIGKNCLIEPGVVIKAGVEIGDFTKIYAHTVINEGVKIGRHCEIQSHGWIACTLMGDSVRIGPQCSLGKKGFGFDLDEEGYVSVPQVGRLIIGNHVEIGAQCNIDRGSLDDTRIGDGTRIDSLVQLGHNVQMGKGCVIVSQVGIAGSTTLGDFVMIGGQGGLAGHLKVGDRARIGAQAGVMRDVSSGATVIGAPAIPFTQWQRQTILLEKLVKERGKIVKGNKDD